MYKTNVNNLLIITTRNCNLECEMCSRGERENAYITDNTLDNLFMGINSIGVLVISGGEPFLDDRAIDKIEKVIELILKYQISVGCVRIVTNGTKYNKRIEDIIKGLYNLAQSPSYNQLCISDDEYHEKELERLNLKKRQLENIDKFKRLCLKNNIVFKMKKLKVVYDYGRAKNLDIPKVKYKIEFTHLILTGLRIGNIPIACVYDDGTVTFREYAYDEIYEHALFNINKENMYSGMATYAESVPPEEVKDDIPKRFF